MYPAPGLVRPDKDRFQRKLKEMKVDAVISGNGGCGLCTPKETESCIAAEYVGIPSVMIAGPGFVDQAKCTALNNGVAVLRCAKYPGAFALHTEAELLRNTREVLWPQIVDALTKPITDADFAEGGGISPERSEPRKRSLEGCDCVGRTVVFPNPTDATNEILRAISDEVKYLYLPGIRYRKTGIVFFGLEKPGTAHQLDLFADASTPAPRQSALYKAVDALNAKYGKGKVFSAAEGIGKKSWHMKRQKLTPRPTTRWDELIVVR